MYDILSLFIIFASLIIIIFIIVRKFPVLASLDVDSIQSEKEAKFKEQIIGNRLKRNIVRYNSKFVNFFKPILSGIEEFGKAIYKKLLDFKENYNKHEASTSVVSDVDAMLVLADEFVKEDKLEEAEKKYIEIISVDSQNLKAFKGLGKLYQDKKQYLEAKQTFEHILRLLEHDESKSQTLLTGDEADKGTKEFDNNYIASIYFELALACKNNEEYRAALTNIIKATDLEPNNPRYLDMKLEISIMNNDKGVALDALRKFKEVNPDNGKILEFEERVKEM